MALVAQDIPKVGLVMENSRLVRWLKNVGDTIVEGEPILELETEKSVVEIEATVSGRLVEQLIAVDQEAHVGDRVAWVESDKAQPEEALNRRAAESGLVRLRREHLAAKRPAGETGRVRSSPVGRRLADKQNGIDLTTVVGTGPRGRIQLKDVQRAIEARSGERRGFRGIRGSVRGTRTLPCVARSRGA